MSLPWHITKAPTNAELSGVLNKIIHRTVKLLEKRGLICRDEEDHLQLNLSEDDALARLQAGAATYRFTLGPSKGKKALRSKPCQIQITQQPTASSPKTLVSVSMPESLWQVMSATKSKSSADTSHAPPERRSGSAGARIVLMVEPREHRPRRFLIPPPDLAKLSKSRISCFCGA